MVLVNFDLKIRKARQKLGGKVNLDLPKLIFWKIFKKLEISTFFEIAIVKSNAHKNIIFRLSLIKVVSVLLNQHIL
jgi:hypothetical protein